MARLYEWQAKLLTELEEADNGIVFVVDLTGCQGTTWFTKYYSELHNDAKRLRYTMRKPMRAAAREGVRVFLFDFLRSKHGDISYEFLEDLAASHVVVAMLKEEPCIEDLTTEDYRIIHIEMKRGESPLYDKFYSHDK